MDVMDEGTPVTEAVRGAWICAAKASLATARPRSPPRSAAQPSVSASLTSLKARNEARALGGKEDCCAQRFPVCQSYSNYVLIASNVQIFRQATNDEKKRERCSDLFDCQLHRPVARLLGEAKALNTLRYGATSRFQRRLERALQIIDSHAVVGDVFIQSQGQPFSFAWGSTRLLLRLGTADLDAFQDFSSNLNDIDHQIGLVEERLNLFPTNGRVFDAATHLFAAILRYVVQGESYLKATKPLRAAKAASGGSAKLKRMIDEIGQDLIWLDREFDNAVETRNRRHDQVRLLVDTLASEAQSELQPIEPVEPTPGTCVWFTNSPEFQAWEANNFDGILLVEGLPGCGKTFLAEYIFRSASTQLKIPYSFYNAPKGVSFTASVLIALLETATTSPQSVKWHDSVVEEALPLSELIPHKRQEALRRLPEVLNNIFSKDEFPETLIIVDALSECADDREQGFFGYLESISRSPKIRLVALSRSDLRFTSTRTIKMDQSKMEHDVRAYAKARIAGNEGLGCVSNQILARIPQICSGMFLPMKLVLDDLEQADCHEDQLEILKQAPNSLFGIYEQIWSREEPAHTSSRSRRREIFRLLVTARNHLSVDAISVFIALDVHTNKVQSSLQLHDPLKTVEKLCRPFVAFMERRVEIRYPSMKDFVKQRVSTPKDPDAYLAEKCLSVLSQDVFASVPYAAALLRKHLLPEGLSASNMLVQVDEDPVPYEYAALHWWEHVTAVKDPSDPLLSKLYDFITGIPSVTWSERLADLRPGNEATTINVQIDIRAELSSWVQALPPAMRPKIPLEDFFVTAHNKIRHELAQDDDDRLLPFLPAIRLGQWYNIGGQSGEDFQKAYDYKKVVVDGFTKVLGKRSPLTLKARTEWVKDFFFQGRIEEAERELSEIVQIEKEISGAASPTFFKALQLLGAAQYCMTKFNEALASLRESGTGLQNLFGTEQWVCQVNDLYEGWVLERLGDTEESLKRYESIVEHWIPIAGRTNGLSLMAITSIGSVQRKLKNYEAAKSNLLESWTKRRRQFSLNSNTTVDSGLQLAVTYRESMAYDDALKILKQVGESSAFGTDFERECQAAHIRALVAFDKGEFERPKNELSGIIDETIGAKRDQNNRECLWIRTTLADALIHHGDDKEAEMLFSELVKPLEVTMDDRPRTPTLEDEQEPPSQLKIAEKALRLVKDHDESGAAELLKKNGLQWVRQKDFWIQQGGPPTDTAWMKPERL